MLTCGQLRPAVSSDLQSACIRSGSSHLGSSMLRDLRCVPCRKGEPLLGDVEIQEYLAQVPNWKVIEREGIKRLERVFRFDSYAEALAFTSRVGKIAEDEDHHPAILTEWGKVTVWWWTHTVKGLHRNDFIMAAKTDVLYG